MSEYNQANRDPLTNEPGAHPVGTGLGAAMGGAATGAAVGAMAGPAGAAVGGVVGAVAGGLAGKAAAEALNPTQEDAYWRDAYVREPYYVSGRTYEQYQPAYELGWSSVTRYDGDFDAIEPRLADDWRAMPILVCRGPMCVPPRAQRGTAQRGFVRRRWLTKMA